MVLKLVFWDVQHGSSTYIRTPNGTHLVQDLGTGSYDEGENFSPLLHLKNKYSVSRLDYVIITHPHKDHIEDIINFYELSPKTLLRPKNIPKEDIEKNIKDNDKEIFDKYFEIDQNYNHPVVIDPADPSNNGGVDIKFFVPNSCSTSNLNNQSVVTVVSYEGIKVILPGDNESCSWNELLSRNDFKEAISGAHVFLAPHHGRESGFHSDLFDHFNPLITIVSDSKSVDTSDTERYAQLTQGWDVHRRNGDTNKRYCLTTRKDGVIVVKIGRNSDGNNFLEVTTD